MVTDNISAGSSIRLGPEAASQKPFSPAVDPVFVTWCEKQRPQQSPVPDAAQVHGGTQRSHTYTVVCRTQKPQACPQSTRGIDQMCGAGERGSPEADYFQETIYSRSQRMHNCLSQEHLTGNMTGSASSSPLPACRRVCLSPKAHTPAILVSSSCFNHTIQMVSSLVWTPHTPTLGSFKPEAILLFLALFKNTEWGLFCLGVCCLSTCLSLCLPVPLF